MFPTNPSHTATSTRPNLEWPVLAHVQRGRTVAAEDGIEYTPEDVSPLTEKKSQLLQALFQANIQLRELHDEDASQEAARN